MSNGPIRRLRSGRSGGLELPPGRLARFVAHLRRGDVLARLSVAAAASIVFWVIAGMGVPLLSFREGDVPTRDVAAKVDFRELDLPAKEQLKVRARDQAFSVYDLDVEPLDQLQAKLRNTIGDILAAPTLMGLNAGVWDQFDIPPTEGAPPSTQEHDEEDFQQFRAELSGDDKLASFHASLEKALAPFEQRGLLSKVPAEHTGNQQEIFVQPVGQPERRQVVRIEDVLIGDGSAIRRGLKTELVNEEVAERIFHWLRNQLPETLRLNAAASTEIANQASEAVPDQFILYKAGQTLAKLGVPLTPDEIKRLKIEHLAFSAERPLLHTVWRSLAIIGLVFGLYGLAAFSLSHRAPELLRSLPRLTGMLMLALAAAALSRWLAEDKLRAEIVPLVLFGMTMAIAYQREAALLLTLCLAVIIDLSIGRGLGDLIILVGSSAVAIVMLDSVRSRTKLIRVGLGAGLAAFLVTLGVGVLNDRPASWELLLALLTDAGRNGLWGIVAGLLITALLPFIEKMFGVLTDLSLLELGDVAHPLLQELVRRAPGTYNHSINVASIAEAAAESIGARGLLVRVGAYFHDIGKMLKPAYFVENQGPEASRHESLVPAMSTLIIIAHVKDGADLGRKHHLPQPLIDFIEQHHGTTLVEYFYRRASENRDANPDGGEVDEDDFRYPGPKPQSKEAGVMMLADAVESAGRALVEPAPARIEGLVRDIAMKRLLDGQFDESGLNLSELRLIQDSLIKSLIAVYHGRVKYPEPRTA